MPGLGPGSRRFKSFHPDQLFEGFVYAFKVWGRPDDNGVREDDMLYLKAIGIWFGVTFLLNILILSSGGSNLKLSSIIGIAVAGGFFLYAKRKKPSPKNQ